MRLAVFARRPWHSAAPNKERWGRLLTVLGLAGLAVGCFLVYAYVGPNQAATDGWFPLATSLLHGHFWIDGSRPYIELVPAGDNMYYLPFPPIPAVILVPIVAIFGQDFTDTSGVCALVGAINVLLVVSMLHAIGLRKVATLVLTLGFAFGSEVFYVTATGGIHHWTEALVVCFVLAAINLAIRGRYPWLAGIFFGLAVGCRPTIILAAPAFAVLYWRDGGWLAARGASAADSISTSPDSTSKTAGWGAASRLKRVVFAALDKLVDLVRRANWVGLVSLALGAAAIGVWLAYFNFSRFGSPTEFGYDLIKGPQGQSVLSESWYPRGIVSPFYLARGLFTMLLRGWDFNENFPWVEPNWAGCSILYTTPILVYLLRARWRDPLILAGWLGLVLPVTLDLMHGNPGYAQFGYRFILDGLPFAWLLLGLVVLRNGLTRGHAIAVAVGMAVNAYGLACIAAGFVS
ncbi:MAG TPA: hypothetical protein VF375_02250 [Candidatus Limnocylindrales bacterium]